MRILQLGAVLAGYLQQLPYLGPYLADVLPTFSAEPFAPQYTSFPIDLRGLFDNIAVGPHANFDHWNGESWDPDLMPRDSLEAHGIEYILPQKWDGSRDNVIAKDQVIEIPDTIIYPREMHILYAGDFTDGETGATFIFHFEDGTEQRVEASIHNWWCLHWINSGAVFKAPYHIKGDGRNYNQTQMYSWTASIRTTSQLKKITLPGYNDWNRLHIFAMTLVPSKITPPYTAIRETKFTSKWRTIRGKKAFALEVTIANPLPTSLAADPTYWVNSAWIIGLNSPEFYTVQYGEFKRLMPGDQVIVNVWFARRPSSHLSDQEYNDANSYMAIRETLSQKSVTIEASSASGEIMMQSEERMAEVEEDPLLRDIPEWFGDAKFGIFMHWGVFSIPGWAPPGPYAEWYWWWMHRPTDSSNYFWNYHREHYGEDFVYDDFIPQLGTKFNASEIIDVVVSSGAKYFVPTSMHHDGFAIFDTENATHRSSVYLGPKRDFLAELFDDAKERHPDLVRGTYFSMPEWYNPDVGEGGYGWGTWPGHLARNAYDLSKAEPYTGRIPGREWLKDQQLAKMKILAEKYQTSVMWCDIGGPNLTRTFLEEWLPFVDEHGIQPVMNNRCGSHPQFDTPEYAKFSSIQTQKWESSESVDPYSYGYNRYTKPDSYRSPYYIISSLIDIVSKNGNYLLNIGPDGDGIVPTPVVERLSAVGSWLKHSGDCIYGTNYFFFGAESGHLRFTRTASTFCIIALERPKDGLVVIDTPIPVLENDTINLLGAGTEGENLSWAKLDGSIVIKVTDELLDKIQWAWAFQVTYNVARGG